MKPQNDNEPLLEGEDVPEGLWKSPAISAEFRETVFARTTAHLRTRIRRRRLIIAGGLMAAAYACGVITAFVAFPSAPPESPAVAEVTVAKDTAVQEHAPAEPSPVTDALLQDPEAFSLLIARSTVDKQIEILKSAGDRYLSDFGDIDQAMNCYRRMLTLEQPRGGVEMNVDDSWLLKSMKQARLQEDDHENATT